MKTPTVLLVCSLFLCSCGGNDPSVDPDEPTVPDADQAANEQPIELTDELMEQYVVIAKEAQAASNAGSMAFLATHRWSLERWMKVSAAVTQGMISASRAQLGDAAATSRADMDKRITAIEAQLKTAPESERAALQMQLDALKNARSMMAGFGAPTDLDRRNAETLKRWMPKLEAIGKEK